ncbi:hypothetical protein LAWI1_G005303, partial [Lachnellula willkommii]
IGWARAQTPKRLHRNQLIFPLECLNANVYAVVMALVVTYLPMFLPPPPTSGQATGTEAPAAAPPAGV